MRFPALSYFRAHRGAAERLIDRRRIAAIDEVAVAVVAMADLSLIATRYDSILAHCRLSLLLCTNPTSTPHDLKKLFLTLFLSNHAPRSPEVKRVVYTGVRRY